MTNFITDETELAFPKTARRVRTDIPAEEQIRHTDWNAVCQALYDTREYLADTIVPGLGGAGLPVFRVAAVTKAAIVDAITAANTAGGGTVVLPAGTYELARDGVNTWCLDIAVTASIVLQGVPGETIITCPTGLPAISISLLRFDEQENITIRDIIFDGNWGATTGVTTTQAGINHATQADPKNHAIMLRGCDNVVIERCIFRNLYGDGVWMGCAADDDLTDLTTRVTIRDCEFNLCARNGVSFGAPVDTVTIDNCWFNDIYTSCIDAEPQGGPFNGCKNVVINNNRLKGWWNGQYFNLQISCVAGDPTGFNVSSAARTWRITNNRIHGSVYVAGGLGNVISDNYIYSDTSDATYALAPLWLSHQSDALVCTGNMVYDVGAKSVGSGGPHNGAIQITFAGAGDLNAQPVGVVIRDNFVFPRNGVNGIYVNSPGGFSRGLAAVVPSVAGTATGVTALSLTHTGAGWTTNRYAGWTVTMGGKQALIVSNTSDVLTLQAAYPGNIDNAWFTPIGELSTTPVAGTYTIESRAGVVVIEGNHIDCGADGNPEGGDGIVLFQDRAGGRISVRNNYIKNCGNTVVNGWGIHVIGDTPVPSLFIEIRGNRIWDDQAVATTAGGIRFASAASLTSIGKLVMADNSTLGGVSTLLSGVAAGKWLLADGDVQQWVGFGVPAHSAPQCSTYLNKSGTGADSFYVNTDGGTTWSAR